MPPLFVPRRLIGKPGPVVLPHDLANIIDLETPGWPQFLLLLPGFGLPDPAAGYWHGLEAANDDCADAVS